MCKLGLISQERSETEVKLLLSANTKSYMRHRLAQRMTLSDLEWPFHGSAVPSVGGGRALKELNVGVNALCTSSTLKSTSSASRAVSAVAELFVFQTAIGP